MSEGKCRLCGESGGLRDSHLLPKALYRLFRSKMGPHDHPVLVTGGRAGTTSKQAKQYLLCDACEARFSRLGEVDALSNCYRGMGQFGYRRKIARWELVSESVDFDAYSGPESSKDIVASTLYFAASVIWRAAVAQWEIAGNPAPKVKLGKYEHEFRKYLLGRAPFPKRTLMFLGISDLPCPENIMTPPVTIHANGYHRHKFTIPGVLFILLVGNRLPPGGDMLSLSSTPPMAYFGDIRQDGSLRRMLAGVASAKWIGRKRGMPG